MVRSADPTMNTPPRILDAADRDRKDFLCTVLKDDDLGDSVRFSDSEGGRDLDAFENQIHPVKNKSRCVQIWPYDR